MIGWSPRQIRKTRSSPSTATPATSRCSNPFGSCSQPSTTSYLMVGLLRAILLPCLARPRAIVYRDAAPEEATMRMSMAWLVLAVVLLASGALVAAPPAGTPVVGLVAEPVNLDPAQVTDLNSNRVGRRIAETLVTFPDERTQIVPGLAESWTVSKDGLRYTFKLRKGVSFHDGTPFSAEAVSSPSSGRSCRSIRSTSSASIPSPTTSLATSRRSRVDPLTVEFALKPRASFLAVLAAGAASVVPS